MVELEEVRLFLTKFYLLLSLLIRAKNKTRLNMTLDSAECKLFVLINDTANF